MIKQETAADIWAAYREIEAANKLLVDMNTEMEKAHLRKDEPTLRDAFGRRRNLQLGVPSGENGHRIFDVAPQLAASVIRAHIAAKKVELAEANERARIEVNADE